MSKEKLAMYIAESDSQAVEFCIVSVSEDIGEADLLYTAREVRNQSIGKQLMKQGLELLSQQEVKHMRLNVGEGNEEVLTFYEKFGFKKRATQMEKI